MWTFCVQGLRFFICVAIILRLLACALLADVQDEAIVKLAVAALLSAPCKRNFVPPIKINYIRDCRIGSWEYAQAFSPQRIANTMPDRTEGTISLLPTGSISGSVWLMCLRTPRSIIRTQWTVLTYISGVSQFHK